MAIGHEVRLMPPAYVKAYAKRGKTDAADAEAIAEAVIGPTTRFVAVKYKAQQAVLMLHKTRDLLVHQRTMLINALWGDLGEFGIVAPQGPTGVQAALKTLRGEDQDLPDLARAALGGLAGGISKIGGQLPSTPSGRWGDGCINSRTHDCTRPRTNVVFNLASGRSSRHDPPLSSGQE